MKIFPLAISLWCLVPAHAAQTMTPEVLVSATRSVASAIETAANINIIDRQEIIDSGARHLSELLRTQAGIHLSDAFTDGSNATIDMRGFGSNASSNTLVMIDGRKLNPASDSATLYLNSVSLSNIERIEVIQGSAGVLFGNQAVGGVINIITRQPDFQEIDVDAGLGSFNGKSLSAHSSHRLSNGIGYRLAGHLSETDNYRDNNQASLKNLSALLDYRHKAGRVFAEFTTLDETTHMPGALFADELMVNRRQSIAAYANDYIDTNSHTWRLGLDHQISTHWSVNAEMGHRRDDREFLLSFRAFPGSLSTQDRETVTANPRLIGNYTTQHGKTIITLGYDHENTDYLLQTAFGPQGTKQDIDAIYAQLTHPLTPDLNLTTGFRHAEVKNTINTGTSSRVNDKLNVGSMGISYRVTPAWRVFARADQNYRFAKVDEHTNVVFGQPTGLETQTGVSYELGMEYQQPSFQMTAQVYRLNLQNEIGFDSSTFYNVNLDDTRRNGLSVSTRLDINPDWSVGASYDYVNSQVTAGAFSGNDIPLVAEHETRLFINWTPGLNALFGAEIHHVGEQTLGSDFSNSFNKLKGYTVVNANAHFYYENWDFSARINNLFNQRYSETGATGYDATFTLRDAYNPSAERHFAVNARYTFD